MDFLDPQKQRAHMIRIYVGYFLIGALILMSTIILLYWAYGFGLDKQGKVVQNGLVFVSSQPGGADVLINGKKWRDTTGTRIQLNEGDYSLDVKRSGYRPWHRDITVTGSSVSRYDYPLLIPTTLDPTPVRTYANLPALATQSPDRKWVVVQKPGTLSTFDVYDLGNPDRVADTAKEFTLPASTLTTAEGDRGLKLVEWSTNNRHVILLHTFDGGSEYILIDREEPERSVNLSELLGLTAGQVVTLRDKKFDKYYIHDTTARTLTTVVLDNPQEVTPVLTDVVAFKSYGDDILLYATQQGAPEGKLMTMLRDGDVTYRIRDIGPGAPYLLDLAQYDGNWFVAVGASSDNRVYVYENPQAVRKAGRVSVLTPVRILRVTAPNYLAFSSNTRFIAVENSTSFAIYDAETDKDYSYVMSQPLDPGIEHATWMDGHRLSYVTSNQLIMFDYDNINFQTLVSATPTSLPFFDRDYDNVYTLTPPTAATGQSLLTRTNLLAAQDR